MPGWDWPGFFLSLVATFAGVFLAFALERRVEARREAKRHQGRQRELETVREKLLKDLVFNAQGAQTMFAMELYGNIVQGPRDVNYANVTYSAEAWKALGARYCALEEDMQALLGFATFYRLLEEARSAYLSPGESLNERRLSEFRRSGRIQEAVQVGRALVEKYGTPELKDSYPKPEELTRTVEQARAVKAKQPTSTS